MINTEFHVATPSRSPPVLGKFNLYLRMFNKTRTVTSYFNGCEPSGADCESVLKFAKTLQTLMCYVR